ncbi:hypothetical protein V8F06_005024 [Rhypophila decipiens]
MANILVVAMSYCAASFVSAVVPISMERRRNNSNAEPVAEPNNDNRYKNSSSLQGIARLYAGAMGGDSLSARGVLELGPRVAAAGHGWSAGRALSERLMDYELTSARLEDIHEGALRQGTRVGVSVSLCSRCELDPHSSFRVHKDHAAVFQHILQSTPGSLPLAMQTVWTILAQMAYYDRLPEFNVKREASIASFRQALVPVGVNGLVFVVAIIIIQNVAVALIVVLFLRRTRLSLVGNLSQGFGQLVASDVSRMALRTTVASDKEVLSQLEKEGVRTSSVSLAYDFQGKVSRLESRVNIG